jgi:hypothetical protein
MGKDWFTECGAVENFFYISICDRKNWAVAITSDAFHSFLYPPHAVAKVYIF